MAEPGPAGSAEVHEEIIRQLVTLVRGTAHMQQVAPPTGAPALERPAFVLLIRLSEQGPARVSTLAGCLQVDLSTVSRQLTALESAGWVAREPDLDDRRASLVRITDVGLAVLRANKEARRAAIREMLADWPEDDRADFARLLARMNSSMAAHRESTAPVRASTTPGAAVPAPVRRALAPAAAAPDAPGDLP